MVLTESTVVREAVFISLRGGEAALGSVIDLDGVLLREELSGDLSVRLAHGVLVDHSADVTSVAWDLLAADHVRGTGDPVLRELAAVAEDILVHLGTGWQIDMAHHALLESDAADVGLIATRLVDFTIDSTRSLSEKLVLDGHEAGVAR